MAGDPEQEAAYRAGDLRLFESGLFSDVVVGCGSRSWNLHRNILCTRSIWFQKAVGGQLMVSSAWDYTLFRHHRSAEILPGGQ